MVERKVADAAKLMERQHFPDWKLAYRVDEACAATGYGKSKMWELVRSGKLKAKKDGGITVIRRVDLAEYIDNLPARPPSVGCSSR